MRKTLLTLAAILSCLVQATTGSAQIGTFLGTVDDIPTAAAGEGAAYYVPESGDVIVSVGPGVSAVSLNGLEDFTADDFNVENLNAFSPLAVGALVDQQPNSISYASFFGLPSGVFNLGPILPADNTITDGGSFEAVFGSSLVISGASPAQTFEFPFQVVSGPADVEPVLGDFNGDSVVDVNDLDEFDGNLNQPAVGELEQLDLDSDGQVTKADFEIHYLQLIQTSNGQAGTFLGDANLDGSVDTTDVMILIQNLFNEDTSWSGGNFNADSRIDVLGDGFAVVANLGNSN